MKWYLHYSVYILTTMPALQGMAYPKYPDGALYNRLKNALHAYDNLTIDFLVQSEREDLIALFKEPKNHLLSFIVRFAYEQYDEENPSDTRKKAEQVLTALHPLFTDPKLNKRAKIALACCLGEPVHQWIRIIWNS